MEREATKHYVTWYSQSVTVRRLNFELGVRLRHFTTETNNTEMSGGTDSSFRSCGFSFYFSIPLNITCGRDIIWACLKTYSNHRISIVDFLADHGTVWTNYHQAVNMDL
jgi:hypothetical protein